MQTESKAKAADILLHTDHSTRIEQAEIVRTAPHSNPTSIRLSAPLLEALDALANAQHRKRGNLIQHILWEYVHSQKT